MGDAFQNAAESLAGAGGGGGQPSNYRIPICFLYRHAIELYLKSIIVILHRALKLPFGSQPYNGPAFIPIDKEWKPLRQVHSIGKLWGYALSLIKNSEDELKKRCETDWQDTPEDLIKAIAEIE